MTKDIWLPKGETKVTVHRQKVTVWDEMIFTQKPIEQTGFSRVHTEVHIDGKRVADVTARHQKRNR